jgi:hypothetical protein
MDNGNSVNGKAGRAINFDGTTEYIDFPGMNFGNSFTISMWVNVGLGGGIKTLMANSLSGLTQNGFRLFVNTDLMSDRKIHLETGDGANTNTASTLLGAVGAFTWTHVAVQVNHDGGQATIRVNGNALSLDTSIDNDFQTTGSFELGRMGDIYHLNGALDQVEVASVIRSSEWLGTAFRNQQDPGAFHSFGAQENRP